MKQRLRKKGGGYYLLFAVMILAALLFIGCGSDGDTGPPGPKGDTGDTGPAGDDAALTATAETCSICHGEGKIADVGVAHPDNLALLGDDVVINNISLVNNAGVPVVSFHLERADDGAPIDISSYPVPVDNVRVLMADLVPAGTPTDPTGFNWGTFDTDYWERWARERGGGTYPQGPLDISDAANGNYTYTFATGFGSATALADAPDLDHTPGASHVQRLFIRFDGSDDSTIFLSNGRGVGFLDFIVPAADGVTPATALDPQRQFITSYTCEQCHSANWERAPGGHASGRRDIKACVMCHSPIGFDQFETDPVEANRGQFMQDTDTYASVFFHKIHAAKDIEFWREEGRIRGEGYVDVTFPQHDANGELRDCVICHNNDGNEALGSQEDLINNWRLNPTSRICVSCHTDVDPAVGTNHGGGAQPDNSSCLTCHPGSLPDAGGFGRSIPNAHDITPHVADASIANDEDYVPERIPEFDVNIALSPDPANGTHYVTGDVITVTVTLVDRATGLPVAGSVYTTSQDDAGVPGGGLQEAFLQVYGPRAMAIPSLATDTEADPNFTGDFEDEHELFVESTDPQVSTDSTGFKYQLFPIPADQDPGTYVVRFEGGDYGALSGTDFITHSTAVITFQVGTATEEFRVSGVACVNCHGNTRMHEAGMYPHNAAFATDECLACHHDSGHDTGERVHGVPIANRVHAIHSANAKGDIYFFSDPGRDTLGTGRDWTEITFPREIANCNTCHNSQFDAATNTFEGTYKTLPYMMPCAGCHVGDSNDFQGDLVTVPGVADHMIQNGGPWVVTNSPD